MKKKTLFISLFSSLFLAVALIIFVVNHKGNPIQTGIAPEYQVIEKAMAIEFARTYIIKNDIEVIDINNPSEVIEDKDAEYWNISFEVEQEPVPLPPFRSFNVHYSGKTYEVPRR